VIGAALGAFIAWRRKGNRLDMLHYAGVLGLIGLIIGTFVGLYLLRGGA
jgi:ABC-type antimicrobial peptide transport system permease subunit